MESADSVNGMKSTIKLLASAEFLVMLKESLISVFKSVSVSLTSGSWLMEPVEHAQFTQLTTIEPRAVSVMQDSP